MFYDQVKSLCKSRGIAISTLARNLHLSPSAPNNWKEGTLPKAETIMKLSEFFHLHVSDKIPDFRPCLAKFCILSRVV